MAVSLVCIDCKAEGLPLTRKATRPGPRCASHKRLRRIALSEALWAKNLLLKYGLSTEEYWALYDVQGGVCAICARSKGKNREGKGTGKRLAVDHDHKTGKIRGLCCGKCNGILGWFRDLAGSALRMAGYLQGHTPAAMLGLDRVVPGGPDKKRGSDE
jgi:recombination endonuclease VII